MLFKISIIGDVLAVLTDSFEDLKKQVEEEAKTTIKEIKRKNDNLKIKDEKVFAYLIKQAQDNNEKEIELIATVDKNKLIKVSTIDADEFTVLVDSLDSLKKETELKVNSEIKEFRRKKDDLLIDSDIVLNDIFDKAENAKETLWLIAYTDKDKKLLREKHDSLKQKLSKDNLRLNELAGIFLKLKESEKCDLCFLVDCTGSMQPWIAQVKASVMDIVDRLKDIFAEFYVRLAFVGYRDFEDAQRFVDFQFSDDIEQFKAFVDKIQAKGGDDECEDIFGGLDLVTNLRWVNTSRALIHIGDAPCHGKRFYEKAGDSHPEGDPTLNITDLLRNLKEKNVSYYFAELNETTRKMIEEFNKEMVHLRSNKIVVGRLPSKEGVTKLVIDSLIRTVMESKSLRYLNDNPKEKSIVVDETPITDFKWDPKEMTKLDAIYMLAKFNGQIPDIRFKKVEFDQENCELWIAKRPFDKGAMRFAYAGLLKTPNDPEPKKVVIKESKFVPEKYNNKQFFAGLIENQVIAKFLAEKYFEQLKRFQKHVKFIDVNLVYTPATESYYTIEEFISKKFVKWSSNSGRANPAEYSCSLDAFAHWTHHVTSEYLLVSDLQGFRIANKDYILTDPAIICAEDKFRFSLTNLASFGIEEFFKNHACNQHCKALKLPRNAKQTKPDRIPREEDTVAPEPFDLDYCYH